MFFKELRSTVMVYANTLKNLPSSRELSITQTSLQNAMMWCGQMLKYNGQGDNPYANNGNRKTVADIEPMYDKTEAFFVTENEIELIDTMRESIQKDIYQLVDKHVEARKALILEEQSIQIFAALQAIQQHLVESRMWLGMELGRRRDEVVTA